MSPVPRLRPPRKGTPYSRKYPPDGWLSAGCLKLNLPWSRPIIVKFIGYLLGNCQTWRLIWLSVASEALHEAVAAQRSITIRICVRPWQNGGIEGESGCLRFGKFSRISLIKYKLPTPMIKNRQDSRLKQRHRWAPVKSRSSSTSFARSASKIPRKIPSEAFSFDTNVSAPTKA